MSTSAPSRRPLHRSLRRARTTPGTLLLASFLAGCGEREVPGSARFHDVTEEAGFDYVGTSYGASWGDFDGDGLPDLFASGHSPLFLYHNQGDGTFRNIGPKVVQANPGDMHGAAWADFDGDGDQDLVRLAGAQLGHGTGPNHLLVQEDGRLVDRAEELGVDLPLGRGRTPLWLDFDGDGRLDILATHGEREGVPSVLLRQGAQGFEEAPLPDAGAADFALLTRMGSTPSSHVLMAPSVPGWMRALDEQGWAKADATFDAETTAAADAVFVDVDNDLDFDLVVAQAQTMPGSILASENEVFFQIYRLDQAPEVWFRTAGDVTVEIEPSYVGEWSPDEIFLGAEGLHPEALSFGMPRDATSEGLAMQTGEEAPRVLVGYDREEEIWRLRLEGGRRVGGTIQSTAPIVELARRGHGKFRDWTHTRLLENRDGTFVDVSERLGLGDPLNAFSIGAGDFDNDGDVDLYFVCSGWVSNRPNVLLENQGDGSFLRVREAGGALGSVAGKGDVVAVADYDIDGFLDLFVANGHGYSPPAGPHQLLRNQGNENHWIALDLQGGPSNRDGIGARVIVTAGGVRQVRVQDGGMHNRTQNHSRLHFGLGPSEEVERIAIEWPSGARQELAGIAADQVLRIVEED